MLFMKKKAVAKSFKNNIKSDEIINIDIDAYEDYDLIDEDEDDINNEEDESVYSIEDKNGNCWSEVYEYFCDRGTQFESIEDMPYYIECPEDLKGRALLVLNKKKNGGKYIDEKTGKVWGKIITI